MLIKLAYGEQRGNRVRDRERVNELRNEKKRTGTKCILSQGAAACGGTDE